MKFLILFLILILTASVFAQECSNKLPMSEAIKAINLEPNAGAKTCKDLPSEECLCFDSIDGWEVAEIVDEEIEEVRWSGKFNRTPCENEETCKALLPTLCESGKEPFYDIEGESFEAYCAFKLSPVMVKTGRKLLVNNAAKKAAREARKLEREQVMEAKKLKKENAKAILKSVDIEKITTVKALKEVVKELIELVEAGE